MNENTITEQDEQELINTINALIDADIHERWVWTEQDMENIADRAIAQCGEGGLGVLMFVYRILIARGDVGCVEALWADRHLAPAVLQPLQPVAPKGE